MLEKLLDLLKIILEKYLIPALVTILLSIVSVNFITKDIELFKSLSRIENYILQGLFIFLVILVLYSIICKFHDAYKTKHILDSWEKYSFESIINQIDTYPNEVRDIIKKLFANNNNPISISTDYRGAADLQRLLFNKATLSQFEETSRGTIYLCRLTDSFYNKLKKINKINGLISHY